MTDFWNLWYEKDYSWNKISEKVACNGFRNEEKRIKVSFCWAGDYFLNLFGKNLMKKQKLEKVSLMWVWEWVQNSLSILLLSGWSISEFIWKKFNEETKAGKSESDVNLRMNTKQFEYPFVERVVDIWINLEKI